MQFYVFFFVFLEQLFTIFNSDQSLFASSEKAQNIASEKLKSQRLTITLTDDVTFAVSFSVKDGLSTG